MRLDVENNLYINVEVSLFEIIYQEEINVNVLDINLTIIVKDLLIRKYQLIEYNNMGISEINTKDIFNNCKKKNIYIELFINDITI